MNRKGDITITVLVIGIVAVCFIALISFYLAESGTDVSFDFVGKMTKASSEMEDYLAGNPVNFEVDAKGRHMHEEITIKTGVWGFRKTKKLFEIKYYAPK